VIGSRKLVETPTASCQSRRELGTDAHLIDDVSRSTRRGWRPLRSSHCSGASRRSYPEPRRLLPRARDPAFEEFQVVQETSSCSPGHPPGGDGHRILILAQRAFGLKWRCRPGRHPGVECLSHMGSFAGVIAGAVSSFPFAEAVRHRCKFAAGRARRSLLARRPESAAREWHAAPSNGPRSPRRQLRSFTRRPRHDARPPALRSYRSTSTASRRSTRPRPPEGDRCSRRSVLLVENVRAPTWCPARRDDSPCCCRGPTSTRDPAGPAHEEALAAIEGADQRRARVDRLAVYPRRAPRRRLPRRPTWICAAPRSAAARRRCWPRSRA